MRENRETMILPSYGERERSREAIARLNQESVSRSDELQNGPHGDACCLSRAIPSTFSLVQDGKR